MQDDELLSRRLEAPAAQTLFIVEGNWGTGEDSRWLKVGFAWYREEDAIADRDHRTKNRAGVKFRVSMVTKAVPF